MAETKTKSTLKVYEVVTSALVLRVGKARSEVQRFLRGAKLELDSTDERTKLLLRGAAIVEHNAEKTAPVATARIVARAWGAEEDPVAVATPLPASAPEIAETQ